MSTFLSYYDMKYKMTGEEKYIHSILEENGKCCFGDILTLYREKYDKDMKQGILTNLVTKMVNNDKIKRKFESNPKLRTKINMYSL